MGLPFLLGRIHPISRLMYQWEAVLIWFCFFAPLFASNLFFIFFLSTCHIDWCIPTHLLFCFRPPSYTQSSDQLPMSLIFFSITIIIIISITQHNGTVRKSLTEQAAPPRLYHSDMRSERGVCAKGHRTCFVFVFLLSFSFPTILSTSFSHLCLLPSLLCLTLPFPHCWFASHGGAGSAGYLLVVGASTDESKRHVCRRTTAVDTLWVTQTQSHSFTSPPCPFLFVPGRLLSLTAFYHKQKK